MKSCLPLVISNFKLNHTCNFSFSFISLVTNNLYQISNANNPRNLFTYLTSRSKFSMCSLIKSAKAEDGFTYISKAGGALLEWLGGKELPGVRALKENTLV